MSNIKKQTNMENVTLNTKFVKEFDARIYLKKKEFNKMTEGQKNKAAKLLSDFQYFLNAEY
tara:strand:- start:65 stop:247 length:183 start_codon:yes stop_codon:yes gene_type:complete